MKKYILLFLLITCLKLCCIAQNSAQDSIKNTISNMFLAMKNADTILLKTCFADSAFLQTIITKKDGNVKVKTESITSFIAQVALLKKESADEQIVFENINIDGNLANVWTPYKFYFNNKFSHCGVNNFVLIKTNNIWLINYIIDTRRKTSCN